ncbi:MAG TPA: hypothetical protein VNP92_08915 [Actinophytocola sp.]|nr:hypothetical protein [Actinophytocola sp.]
MSTDPANQPLDEVDEAILDQVRAATDAQDPPPADLNERVWFAIRLADKDFEVSRLFEDVAAGAGARAGEGGRAVTFESDSLTIMATVFPGESGNLRVEGWLAPPGTHPVELRSAEGGPASRRVVAEANGRFLFDDVPTGLTQLVVHVAPPGRPVVTTPLLL